MRVAGSAFALTANWTLPGPWPVDPAVMLTHATSACAVHWHSRSVRTSTDPAPPDAGTGVAGASIVTAHLVNVEGEVAVFPDPPHETIASAAATRAATGPKLTDPRITRSLGIIPERLCWAALRTSVLQDARRTPKRPRGHRSGARANTGSAYNVGVGSTELPSNGKCRSHLSVKQPALPHRPNRAAQPAPPRHLSREAQATAHGPCRR